MSTSTRIARGSWQSDIFHALVTGHVVRSPLSCLRGEAKQYKSHYDRSFANLLKRMQTAGYVVARIPGIRGGEWSAKYMLLSSPQAQ